MSERFEASCLNPTSLENSSFLGANSFRPQPHVAQRSRRDKLRVNPTNHIQEYSHNLLYLPRDLALNPDPIQPRNPRNCDLLQDAAMFSSDMLSFSSNSHVLLPHKESAPHQESVVVVPPVDRQVESSFTNASTKAGDPSNPSYWRTLGSHQNSDWLVNYVNSSANNSCSHSTIFVGGNVPTTPYLKPGYTGYHDTQSSLISPASELSSQDSQKQYGEMSFSSPSFCQNTLQEVCTSSSMGAQAFPMASLVHQNIREAGHGPWVDGGNELVLLPSYGNQTNASQINHSSVWMNRSVEGSHQWNNEEGFAANSSGREFGNVSSDHKVQGLSLSLSSHPHPDLHVPQFEERFESENLPSRIGVIHGSQDSKIDNLGHLSSYSKSSIGSKVYGNSVQSIVSSSMEARSGVGPLGPFTGYATILKSSKFLKPAQQLLDEFCSINGPKLVKTCEMSEKGSIDVSFPRDTVNVENEVGGKSGNSGVSSTSFYSSTEACVDGVGSGACQAYRPEFQRKKAKLLYMQEEVCRRYKQYHQQMQMVVSSFESVAGLSAATPYTSLALKAVSKHFRFLKNAISDQIKHISKVLGEEFMSYSGTSKGETATPKLRFIDQSLRKQKTGESLGFLEHQQHVWRPQRGLPERAVAVLRAWLFEHFLHPYPTDTDKHMLATQTGLSRNQVSNWFINARVRVWKPMVEEIHMLETKGSTEMHLTSNKDDGKHITDTEEGRSMDQMNRPGKDEHIDKRSDCSAVAPMLPHTEDGQNPELWHHEKRSRMGMDDGRIPASVDGGLIGFLPYHQGGLEIGGLGTVSLTLGLRNSNESAHQQHQQQLRRFFGDQMVHDFVG